MVFVLRISYTTAYNYDNSNTTIISLFSTYALAQHYLTNYMHQRPYLHFVDYSIEPLNIDDNNSQMWF